MSNKKCLNCGAVLAQEAVYCSECGTKQEPDEILKCAECGATLAKGAKFCMYCGTKVEIAESQAPVKVKRHNTMEYDVQTPDEDTLLFHILGVPFKMKFIKGGMINGCDLSDFYIGETVVTQALWHSVMGDNPSRDNSDLDYPVTNISLNEAKTFLTRLKKITGVTFSIPSASQFLYVCSPDRLNYNKELLWGDGKMHRVCGMMPNKYGLYDLSDWYQMISDLYYSSDYYRFNPLGNQGEYYARNVFLNVEQYGAPDEDKIDRYIADGKLQNKDNATLRIVLDIPVDASIQKAKKEKEEREKASYKKKMEGKIAKQLALAKKYNVLEAKYTPRLFNGTVYIDVEGDVKITDKSLKVIPVHFGVISGKYICFECDSLESLYDKEECVPFYVGGPFSCRGAKLLVNTDGAPKVVMGYFNCYNCKKLEEVLGTTSYIGGDLELRGTSMKEEDVAPTQIMGEILVNKN